MRVQLKTDRHMAAHNELTHQVETVMEGAVGRFADQITRVEVHLSDENSQKGGGDDTRCLLEARLAGLQPAPGDRWRRPEVGTGPREHPRAARPQERASLLRGKPEDLSRAEVNGGGGYLR